MNSNPQLNYDSIKHEEILTKALQEGKDPHKTVASWLLQIPEDQVTFTQRQQIKSINHHLLYSSQFLEKVFASALKGDSK